MPRIDPLQLITCLKILLGPDGGILSAQEVHRLVSLMTKFSKKLVSKCVYVLILKSTEHSLLDSFMNAGGWTLIQLWLHDGMSSMNWALVKEVLELLLITPVDVERLKSNTIPKLVKSLSKREDLQGIHELSSQLVQQWLKIVKGETTSTELKQLQIVMPIAAPEPELSADEPMPLQTIEEDVPSTPTMEDTADGGVSIKSVYKVSLKDGKQVITKIGASEVACEVSENMEIVEEKSDTEPKEEIKEKEKEKKEEKKKSHEKSSSKHKSSSSSKSSSKDKEKSTSSSSHRDRDKHSSSKDKERNRDKEKRDRDKDKKSRSNGSVKSSSSSNSSSSSSKSSSSNNKDKEKDKKETKEKQAEKDKDTLAKLQPQSVEKLPKIPKKSEEKDKSKTSKDSKKEEPKKGTMSIEVRKNNEERPKTVKVYKSKMRLTGLEEEAKPAPPRPTKKPTPTVPVVIPPVPLKRLSPIRDLSVPPEKKSKIEPIERPGAIKLIPPKPKPPVLQESDMFMDALAASATSKKEPKKRKRRASISKDSSGSSPPSSPSQTPANSTPAPVGIKNIAAPKFYQDTLDTEEPTSENSESADNSEKEDKNKTSDNEEETRSSTPTPNTEISEDVPATTRNINGLKGVLVHVRRKGPKKSIKWKADEDLVEVQYFELDETERVNVTKTFGDMAKMDQRGEREAMQMSRKLPNEDVMDVQVMWSFPIEIEIAAPLAVPGSRSYEKDIQFAREKSVLQALYFNKNMLPDSPAEPEPENYQIKDPVTIPIDDVENPEHDFRNKPWPEPKGSPPPPNFQNNVPQIFPNPVQVNFQNFGGGPPPAFQNMPQNMPPFAGPHFIPQNPMAGGEWNNVNMPNMHNPQMMHPNMGPPEMMNQGPMNPNMFIQPPENFNPMMNDNNHRFPPTFNQHQQGPGPGMFPPNNFNTNRGGFGGFRRGGNGPWVRMNGPSPGGWNNMRGGGGGPPRGGSGPPRGGSGPPRGGNGPRGGGGPPRGGRLCINFRNKGYCKNIDNCTFFHPN